MPTVSLRADALDLLTPPGGPDLTEVVAVVRPAGLRASRVRLDVPYAPFGFRQVWAEAAL